MNFLGTNSTAWTVAPVSLGSTLQRIYHTLLASVEQRANRWAQGPEGGCWRILLPHHYVTGRGRSDTQAHLMQGGSLPNFVRCTVLLLHCFPVAAQKGRLTSTGAEQRGCGCAAVRAAYRNVLKQCASSKARRISGYGECDYSILFLNGGARADKRSWQLNLTACTE